MSTTVSEFFVLTVSGSVYRVSVDDPEEGPVVIEKVAKASRSGGFYVGARLTGGAYAGITDSSLTLGREDESRAQAGLVGTCYRDGRTSPIVALFLDGDEAVECAEAGNLKPWDRRWSEMTKATIAAIGRDHPWFILDNDVVDTHG